MNLNSTKLGPLNVLWLEQSVRLLAMGPEFIASALNGFLEPNRYGEIQQWRGLVLFQLDMKTLLTPDGKPYPF